MGGFGCCGGVEEDVETVCAGDFHDHAVLEDAALQEQVVDSEAIVAVVVLELGAEEETLLYGFGSVDCGFEGMAD